MGVNLWGIFFFFGGMTLACIPGIMVITIEIIRFIKRLKKRGTENVKDIVFKG